MPTVVGGRRPIPWNLSSKWPHPLSNTTIPTNIRAHSASAELAKNVQLALIGSWSRGFQPRTSHRWTVYITPKSPKGGTKCDFAVFDSKIQVPSKKSATKFLCAKTTRGWVIATSFLYLMVHRCVAGDFHIYVQFSLKVAHFFQKRRFLQISLNRPWVVRASEKVQLSLIRSRQCAFIEP